MPDVGTGSVPIHPDFSRFGKELERGVGPHIDAAGKDMESTFSASAKKSAASVDAAFARTRVDVPVSANTEGFVADLHRGVDPALKPVDIAVDADTSGFRKLPDELRPHVNKAADDMEATFAKSAKGAGKAIAGAIGVTLAVDLGRKLLDLGNQTAVFRQKTKTVFQEATGDVEKWAKANSAALGLTSNRLAGVAANFGDLLKPMGFTSDEAAKMSTRVIGLAGALSAWSGGTRSVVEVSETLSKAMLGEREELKGLGISISEADVQSRLLANGQGELTGAALQQAKAVATQQLIFEKSTDAQKAWSDGSFEAIQRQNELNAKVDALVESVAEGLLPVFTGAAEVLSAIPDDLIKVAAGMALVGVAAGGITKAAGAVKGLAVATAGLQASSLAGGAALGAAKFAGSVGLVAGAAALLAREADDAVPALEGIDRAVIGWEEKIPVIGGLLGKLDRAVLGIGKESKDAAPDLMKLAASMDDVAGIGKDTADVLGALDDKTGGVAGSAANASIKMNDYADSLKAAYGASMDLLGVQLSVSAAVDGLRDSGADAATKERELAEAIRTHGRASNEAKGAGEALEDARRRQLGDVDSLAQANVRLAEQQAVAAGKTLSDRDKYALYRDELIKVKDTIAPGSPLRSHLEGLINALPPPEVKSKVTIDTASWEASLRQIGTVQDALGIKLPFVGQIGRRHDGGMVGGKGDEVLGLLKPREFVMQESAVAAIGVPTLEALNSFHSGGMVGGAQVLDRIARVAEPVTAMASGTNVDMGGVVLNGVRDGEDALTRLPTRLAAELYLAGG